MTSALFAKGLSAFSVCQNTLGNEGMQQDLDLVVEAGITSVAILESVCSRTGSATTAELLRERNLTASPYMSETKILDGAFAESTEDIRGAIEAAASVGAPLLLMISGAFGPRTITETDDEIAARLQAVSPWARDRGVTLALEPVHPFLRTLSYVHTIRHAAELVDRVPGAGIVLDVGHVYWDRHLSDDIAAYASRVCSVQLTNLSASGIEARPWVRCSLDQGIIPVEDIVRLLDIAGFSGPYEEEVLGATGRQECLANMLSAKNWFAAMCREVGSWR